MPAEVPANRTGVLPHPNSHREEVQTIFVFLMCCYQLGGQRLAVLTPQRPELEQHGPSTKKLSQIYRPAGQIVEPNRLCQRASGNADLLLGGNRACQPQRGK